MKDRRPPEVVDWARVGRFYGLCVGGSTLAGVVAFGLAQAFGQAAFHLVLIGMMFVPLAAVALIERGRDVSGAIGLDVPGRWILACFGVPVLAALSVAGLGAIVPGVGLSWELDGVFAAYGATLPPDQLQAIQAELAELPVHPVWLGVVGALFAGPTVNAVAALGEEAGWRGWLQRELAPLGFWRASLLTGVLWGLWHAPIIVQGYNYPAHPWLGVVLMTAMCTAVSPVFAWLRDRAGSVVGAAVMHGTFNASAGIPLLLAAHADDRLVGFTGLTGILVWTLASVGLGLSTHGRSDPAPKRE